MADEQAILQRLAGKFVVLDGPDGAGKSLHIHRLLDVLTKAGIPAEACRDPGGTVIGDRIRSVLLNYDLARMDVNCETLLFMASRAQLVAEVIRPALFEGKTILCDRYVSSTCAYQGAAGCDPKKIVELARFAVGDCWPDMTVILDIDPEVGFQRIGRKPHQAGKNRKTDDQGSLIAGATTDAMEARPLDFHRKVRRLFVDLPSGYPGPVVVVDAAADAETVYQRILEALAGVPR